MIINAQLFLFLVTKIIFHIPLQISHFANSNTFNFNHYIKSFPTYERTQVLLN